MTDAERLKDIWARHVSCVGGDCKCGESAGHCLGCAREMAYHPWPCDAAYLLIEVERLRKAIQTVLDDNETGAGGWGPDVTMAEVLRVAMEGES